MPVLFVIRTPKKTFTSRPSLALVATTVAIVLVGALLPYSLLAGALGFEPLPTGHFLFLVGATFRYLALVQLAKHWLLGSAQNTQSAPGTSSASA
jgi:P-type Mg2+ transporter